MNELVLNLLITGATIPLAWVILKAIFKKSIMFQFSMITVSFTILATASKTVELLSGLEFMKFVATPFNVVVGVVMYVYINNMLRKPLEKSISQVNDLSMGNLDLDIQRTGSTNELGVLNDSLYELTKSLKSIIGEMMSNADNLAGASEQISSSSEQLSQGANEQAGSIEEVSSTMEQIAANIQQNTENAQQTNKISIEANEGIKEVAEKAGKSVAANKEIADKISIVSDIAFQTNILALNAAVEAARAGEQGKGFAVVAAEVRKLAERSKVAAEQIVSLAQNSLDLAEDAGSVMMQVMPKIEKTTSLVQEIAAASLEQSNGASQVNNAIQQLNTITQQNAASSEELATSAEEMSGQASQMRETISFFKSESYNQNSVGRKRTLKHLSKPAIAEKAVLSGALIDMGKNGEEVEIDNEYVRF